MWEIMSSTLPKKRCIVHLPVVVWINHVKWQLFLTVLILALNIYANYV